MTFCLKNSLLPNSDDISIINSQVTMIIKKISGLAEREALVATLDNPVKLDGFDFDKKPCTTATIPVVQGQKLSRTPLPSF